MVSKIQFVEGLPVAVGPVVPECTTVEVKETAHLLVAMKQNQGRDRVLRFPPLFFSCLCLCAQVYVCASHVCRSPQGQHFSNNFWKLNHVIHPLVQFLRIHPKVGEKKKYIHSSHR